MVFKILFHRHLTSVTTAVLWKWMKGLATLAVALWVIPDCIPFVDEAVVTWMSLSVLFELGSRGEVNTTWLPESVRRRIQVKRPDVVDPD